MGNTNQRHGGDNRIEMASDGSSPSIDGDDLKTGDHVYTWRTTLFGQFGHHGIYVGDGMIIEFTTGDALKTIASSSSASSASASSSSSSSLSKGSGAVGMCNWKNFRGTGSVYRYEYGVSEQEFKEKRSGTCTTAEADAPELVKHRAEYLLKYGYGTYNLFTHNCEDFSLYCKTGLVVPEGRGSSGQAALANIFNRVGLGASSQCSSGTGAFDPEYRYLMDIGVRSDAMRIDVVDLVNSQGGDNNLGENTETRIMGMAYQREDNNNLDDDKMEKRIMGIEETQKAIKGNQKIIVEELKRKDNRDTTLMKKMNHLIVVIIILTIIIILLATIFFSQRAYMYDAKYIIPNQCRESLSL